MTDRPDHIGQMLNFVESLTLPNPSVQGHRLPFRLHGHQKNLLEHYEEFRFAAVPAMRGAGISSCGAAWLIWRATWNPGSRIAALAPTRTHADAFKLRLEGMAGAKAADATGVIEFVNGSRIATIPMDGLPGRVAGGGHDIFYIEDLSLVRPDTAESAWDAVRARIADSEARCVIASTPMVHFDSEAKIIRHIFDDIIRWAERPDALRRRIRESRTIRHRIRAAWRALKAAFRGEPHSPASRMEFAVHRMGWPRVNIARMDKECARDTIRLIGLRSFLCTYMGINVPNNEDVTDALGTLEFMDVAGCLGDTIASEPDMSDIPGVLARAAPGPVGPPAEAWS